MEAALIAGQGSRVGFGEHRQGIGRRGASEEGCCDGAENGVFVGDLEVERVVADANFALLRLRLVCPS
jgi:hypothetical protein